MAKEWILNSATNRWQLNYKRNVGPTSFEIRKCSPKTKDEWRAYYYENVRTEEHLEELGRKLYVKVTEVLPSEIESVTEQDCIDYIKNLVINRTFDGYMTEIETIYGQLQQILQVPIEPASDVWDRKYNVDFFIKVNNKYIGLQIKPVNDTAQIPQIFKERGIQTKTHTKFKKEFGGQVFYIFSTKARNKKTIANPEVIESIQSEINKLKSSN